MNTLIEEITHTSKDGKANKRKTYLAPRVFFAPRIRLAVAGGCNFKETKNHYFNEMIRNNASELE